MKYYLKVNKEQNGWDLMKKGDGQDILIATFYEEKHAEFTLALLTW